MLITHIKNFMELYNTKSFTLAADRMFVSQSTFSKQIKSLETELGVILYDRGQRELTEAGEEFLRFAQIVTREYEIMDDRLNQYRLLPRRKVLLGVIPILGLFQISRIISRFLSANDTITVEVIEQGQNHIKNLLLDDKIDLAILRSDFLDLNPYDTVLLGTDKMVFVCNKDHKLAKNKVIDLQELNHENMILYDSSSELHTLIIEECQKSGFTPNISYTSSRLEVITAMVSEDLGVSILTENDSANMTNINIGTIELEQEICSEVRLLKRKSEGSYYAEKVFEFFHEAYEE